MKIFWTKRSKDRFQEITEYLNSEFGDKSSERFKNRVLDFLELLSKFPELGSLEVPEKQVYGFQLSHSVFGANFLLVPIVFFQP